MRHSWAVTSLAIDPFRQPIRKSRAFLHLVRLSFNIADVTGHAAVADLAAEACVIGTVVTRTHCPVAAVPGIPADGKFYQLSSFRPADVASGVIAGADPVINSSFEDVGRGPVETGLMPLEVRPAIARIEGEEFFGSVVPEGAALQFREIVLRLRCAECPSHRRATVAFRDLTITFRAGSRLHISGVRKLRIWLMLSGGHAYYEPDERQALFPRAL